MNKTTLWAIILIVIIGGGVWWSKSLQNSDPDLVSSNGIHWHPDLAIYLDGQRVDIPSNIGLVGGHAPIHTHDEVADQRETGGVDEGHKPLHLEFGSAVRNDDLRLGNFFEIWGQPFSSECILDRCVSEGDILTMMVNGEENTDFENYIMSDGDRIEIFFDSEPSLDGGAVMGMPAPGVDPGTIDEMIVNESGDSQEDL